MGATIIQTGEFTFYRVPFPSPFQTRAKSTRLHAQRHRISHRDPFPPPKKKCLEATMKTIQFPSLFVFYCGGTPPLAGATVNYSVGITFRAVRWGTSYSSKPLMIMSDTLSFLLFFFCE
jgi:hypothetical protein